MDRIISLRRGFAIAAILCLSGFWSWGGLAANVQDARAYKKSKIQYIRDFALVKPKSRPTETRLFGERIRQAQPSAPSAASGAPAANPASPPPPEKADNEEK